MNAWLIECQPSLGDTLYFCNDGDWCSNPNHAHKFATAVEAQAKLTTMQNPLSMRIAEHQWPDEATMYIEDDTVFGVPEDCVLGPCKGRVRPHRGRYICEDCGASYGDVHPELPR